MENRPYRKLDVKDKVEEHIVETVNGRKGKVDGRGGENQVIRDSGQQTVYRKLDIRGKAKEYID